MKKIKICTAILIAVLQFSCKETKKENPVPTEANQEISVDSAQTFLEAKNFDAIIDNKETHLYWIENNGLKAAFTNYGGRIVGLWMKDKNGKLTDILPTVVKKLAVNKRAKSHSETKPKLINATTHIASDASILSTSNMVKAT